MNHLKVLSRFLVVVFWLSVTGIGFSLANNLGNIGALGWITYLVYGSPAAVILYVGFFVSKFLWNVK